MTLIRVIKEFLNNGDTRSVKAKTNVFRMVFIKGASIICGLLIIPLTLDYVDNDTYGVWLTLSSMVTWISFFDIGLNHGLRNRLTESFAKGNYYLGKKYVSTTYALLFIIFIPLMLLLLLLVHFIDLNKLLSLPNLDTYQLKTSFSIIIIYFCSTFVLNTINVVLLADQRPADAALRGLIQQIVSILLIIILTSFTKGDLIKLCIGMCIAPLIVILIFNISLFHKRYQNICPSFASVDFAVLPDLMKLGIQFFIIQIAGIIQFQLINFLIIKYFGPSEVTEYNIAYKYFSILTMIWAILTAPIWSAVTDAISKNDYSWVKRMIKKYLILFFIFLIISPIMLILSSPAYKLWVGDDVAISFSLSFWIMVFNLVTMFGSTFVNILNGASILKVQTIACCISPLIFLAVTFLMINNGYGITSIIVGSIVANFNGLIIAPLQVMQLLRKKNDND